MPPVGGCLSWWSRAWGASGDGGASTVEQPLLTIEAPPSFFRVHRRFFGSAGPVFAAVLAGCLLLSLGGVLPLPFERVVTLEGRAASRTEFFEDAEVRRILLRHNIEVHMTRAPGSRAMANGNLDGYDFVFPSGQPAAELVSGEFPKANVHRPFLTPIVLATFRPYAEALVAHGIARRRPRRWSDSPEATSKNSPTTGRPAAAFRNRAICRSRPPSARSRWDDTRPYSTTPSTSGSFPASVRNASNSTTEKIRFPPGDRRSASTPEAVYLRSVRVDTPSIRAARVAETIP
ncbi:hypothetical protein GCM10022245_03020 [Streptomyces mayteni]